MSFFLLFLFWVGFQPGQPPEVLPTPQPEVQPAPKPEPAAKLTFYKTRHDFGQVTHGEKVDTYFKFSNTGEATLIINKVTASCGCTTARPEKTRYAPGESGRLWVSFDSNRFDKRVKKTIRVHSNDPKATTVLTVEADVIKEITAEPANIFMSQAQLGEENTAEIRVRTGALENLVLSELSAEPNYLSAEMVRVDDQEMKIIVTAHGDRFPSGKSRLNGMIAFKTNSKHVPEVRTPVTLAVKRPLKATPGSVYLFSSRADHERVMEVVIAAEDGGAAFSVKDIRSSLPYVSAYLKDTRPGETAKRHTLMVVLNAPSEEGRFQGFLSLTTTLEDQPMLKIPIRGSIIPDS